VSRMIAARSDLLQRRAAQAGFTYLWLLLVVALMGVGFASVLELQLSTTRRENEKQLLWIGRQYVNALESYRNSSRTNASALQGPSSLRAFDPEHFPASLEELLKDARFPGTKRHLRTIYNDPMTGKAEWGLLRHGGRIVGVYSLSSETPIKQAGFELDQESFQGAQQYSGWVFVPPLAVQSTVPSAATRTSP
jgi:type II secretory pathway pseudopilin PulG